MNIKTNGKIALRTCSYFIITSLGNAALGAFLAVTFHPGDASIKTALQDDIDPLSITLSDRKNTLLDNFLDLGRNIVPNNLFTSFFEMATTTYTAKVDAAGHEYFVKSLGSRFDAIVITLLKNKKLRKENIYSSIVIMVTIKLLKERTERNWNHLLLVDVWFGDVLIRR